jgi:hypothetical protein
MSAISTSTKVKSLLAVGTLVLSLAVSTGQLTAASFTAESKPPAIAAGAIGQSAMTSTFLFADDSPAVFARAGALRDSFGFPAGAARAGRHVRDGIQKAEYDEVAEVDVAGRPLSLTQVDGKGRLLSAVRFDVPAAISAKVTGDQAAKAARHGLTLAGLAPVGQGRVEDDPAAGGWQIHWDRSEGGLSVRGDETLVHMWADGRVQSVAHVEHDLSAAPASPLNRGKAQDAVNRQFDKWFANSGSGYSVQSMDIQWVSPNATFDSTKVGAAPVPYRLAWVANVKPSGPAAEIVRLVTLYVDAGDGTVIGGDVVE